MVTFVNAKKEIKTTTLQNSDQSSLEMNDPSLFKRLQYAKEVLVQMMGGNAGLEPQLDDQVTDDVAEQEEHRMPVQRQTVMSPHALKASSSQSELKKFQSQRSHATLSTTKNQVVTRQRLQTGRP